MKFNWVSWRAKWWKLWSIRLGLIGTALSGFFLYFPDAAIHAWAFLPADLKQEIPPLALRFIGPVIFVMAMISQFIKQHKLEDKKDD